MLPCLAGEEKKAACPWALRVTFCLTALLITFPAEAQRPDARSMSCAQARALVLSRGAVVMSTGQHTYARFVATAQFCQRSEILDRAWVSTGDGTRCDVGFVCKEPFPRFRH